ncbi:MAG: SPOR domain-containing protein [Acidobacteria bacterium]|nr:SPOR domain-containing protein [Acidobacteriota bacterium]
MTQDDMPAPAVVDEEKAVKEEETAVIEYVPPSPPTPSPKAKPAKLAKPAPPRTASAPDPFAVGVRVLKMAPAWLLFTAVCCSVLVLLLGWVRSSNEVEAMPAKRNDARAAKPAAAPAETAAKAETAAPANASPANASGPKSTAANDAPAPALAQTAAPAPTPQPAPAAAPKADEKPRAETPAQTNDAGGNFTAQVGSHSDQSEANAQVSHLRAAGFDARSVAVELPGRGTWYRVQVGRFAEREEAAKTVAALRAKGAASAALVVAVQK